MKVYRVEMDNGQGPFWNVGKYLSYDDMQAVSRYVCRLDDRGDHPMPSANMQGEGMIYGASTIPMLKKWFTQKSIINLLHCNGFSVKVYKVKSIQYDQAREKSGYEITQVAFQKDNAVLIKTLPMSVLL
jgi:hypothetical protein